MRSTVLLLAVLFAMLWQSLALARPGATVNLLADLGHAALHWHDEGHHHHDDGSYHQDDSIESVRHAIADHVSAQAVLVGSADHDIPSTGSFSPHGLHERFVPSPHLDGLLRPPRHQS